MRIGPGPPVLELGSPSRIPEVSDALPIHELMPLRHFSERSHIFYNPADGPDARDGHLLYVKPVVHGKEPLEVLAYAVRVAMFPHGPTTDQWFTEEQFESYRQLGLFIMTELGRGGAPMSVEDLIARASAIGLGAESRPA
jgi:hypothetical protein